MRQAVSAPNAAKPIGPYSPAIRAGNLLFISGQVGFDPATGALIDGGISAQTDQVMRNIGALLEAAVELAREKTALARQLVGQGRWSVKRVAETLGVSRPHLASTPRPTTTTAAAR